MRWLTDRFRESAGGGDGPLQIMYGIDGRADLEEEVLDHFEGYRGSAPVRIGNGAADQLQLDIYGELIDSVYLYNKYGEPISYDAWMDLVKVLEWLCENWDRPDEGIWETRGGRQHFTYSRLMSWVAIERAIRMARQRGLPGRPRRVARGARQGHHADHDPRLEREAPGVRAALRVRRARRVGAADAAHAVHRAEGPALALDPRRDRQRARLRQPRLPLQRLGRRPTGSQGDEGTFSICSFWYVEALARAGRLDEARLAFEKMLTYANHLGLYSEEIGPSGERSATSPRRSPTSR